MEKILRNFRIALWGILGAFGIYTGMILYNNAQLRGGFDIVFVLTRLMVPGSILLVEVAVYWLIRKRLYYKFWVWIHVISVWLAIVILPITYLLVTYFYRRGDILFTDRARFNSNLSMIFGSAFVISIAAGHLFFILTIVKSFSNKKRLQLKPDVTDSPHILDEFNQQSAGI